MRTTTIFAAAALMTVVAVAPAASAASGDYIAGTGDVQIFCQTEDALGACLGGQIFDVPGDATSVDVRIDDDNVANAGGFYQFADANDEVLTSGGFCSSTSVGVPSGAVTLAIFVDTAFGPLDCPENPPGFATTGTISATFAVPLT